MKTITIKSPVGYVKHKSSPSQPKAMVLETSHNATSGDGTVKGSRFESTGELFTISGRLRGGVVIAIRGDTGNSNLSEWEENSITIPIAEAKKLIQGLQAIVDDLEGLQ